MEKEKAISVLIIALIAVLSLISWTLYTSNQVLETKLGDQQNQIETLENYIQVYSRLFDSNLTPPVSKVEAVYKALISDGWNSSSLSDMEIHVSLIYVRSWVDNSGREHGWEYLDNVTCSLSDYSPKFEHNTTDPWSSSRVLGTMTYRYVWNINIQNSTCISIPPPGLYYVDASTGELFKFDGLGFVSVSEHN